MSSYPLILLPFPYVCFLTSLSDAELGSEASRAAEASRFEAQRLREKAEACQSETRRWEQKARGELHGLPSPT